MHTFPPHPEEPIVKYLPTQPNSAETPDLETFIIYFWETTWGSPKSTGVESIEQSVLHETTSLTHGEVWDSIKDPFTRDFLCVRRSRCRAGHGTFSDPQGVTLCPRGTPPPPQTCKCELRTKRSPKSAGIRSTGHRDHDKGFCGRCCLSWAL